MGSGVASLLLLLLASLARPTRGLERPARSLERPTRSLERPTKGRVPFRPGPSLDLVEGDMVVLDTQGEGGARDTFVSDKINLWTNGIVNYRFDTFVWDGEEDYIFAEEQIVHIREVIRDIEREIPCLRFVEQPSNYTGAHLIFTSMGDAKNNPTSCYSYVGKQGAMDGTPGQVINLGHSDCFEGGRVLHEILHGLGASHEHNRSDRDLYVIINMDNVIPNKTKNFQMQSANYSYHNTPFDTASIMMYGENYFGIDGAVTITALKPGAISDFGNTSTLSLIDKIELGRAYSSVIKGDCFTMENLRLYSEEVDRRRVQAERGWRGAELEKVRAVKEEEDTEKKLGILQSTCTEHTVAQLSVVLESVGGAAENHGSRLGEFQLVGSYRGRPSYVLRDTVGQEDRFLYCEGGWWKVGSMLGGAAAYLAHQGASQDPPQTGWLYADGQGGWQEDPSLVLRGGQLEPCQEVLVMAAGEARRLQGDTVGAYLPTGGWSSGRPVYRQEGGERHYLLVKEGNTAWTVQLSGSKIQSGRGTNSPGDREAGPSYRMAVTRWRYDDKDVWKEGDISVSCVIK